MNIFEKIDELFEMQNANCTYILCREMITDVAQNNWNLGYKIRMINDYIKKYESEIMGRRRITESTEDKYDALLTFTEMDNHTILCDILSEIYEGKGESSPIKYDVKIPGYIKKKGVKELEYIYSLLLNNELNTNGLYNVQLDQSIYNENGIVDLKISVFTKKIKNKMKIKTQ